MSNSPQLEIRQRSAALRGEKTGIRELPVVSKFIDTTTCIGCKACEVACQEWNDLQLVSTKQTGTYQTMPSLDPNFWNLIKFREEERDGVLSWLMRKDQCMHCADPGCLKACPAPGAIVQYENGIVDVNPDSCIGCGLCATGCPFDVPRFHAETGKMSKCTLCVDRVSVGIEPACVKACPTGCLQFGTKEDMLALGQARVKTLQDSGQKAAGLYDPPASAAPVSSPCSRTPITPSGTACRPIRTFRRRSGSARSCSSRSACLQWPARSARCSATS